MRTTVVPAQVTTIEDRIVGSLGLSQLIILVMPVLIGGGLFVLLPPTMNGAFYKYLTIICISILSCLLAVRIKGKVVLFWLLTILRYNQRPKYYLFNKNTTSGREDFVAPKVQPEHRPAPMKQPSQSKPRLQLYETVKVLTAIDNPASNVRFEMKKGALHVRLTEVEE